jgi:ATP-dependent protease ClpP protease subunit
MTMTHTLRRQAFIYNGSIDSSIANFSKLITTFLELNRGNNRPLLLRLTSSGGVPEQINGLCGIIHQVQAEGHPVHVHVLGQLCAFTYMVAAVADKILMEPSASLVFGQMRVVKSGTVIDIASYILFQQELYNKLVNAIVDRSKRSENAVNDETVRSWRGKHLTAQQAHDLGLCDEVLPLPTEPVKKSDKQEHVVHMNGAFSKDSAFVDLLIGLHNWMENTDNEGQPLKIFLTSWGGTVVQALSLYGLVSEIQRLGHHVTIQVMGEAYSCALWFATVALGSGTVLIDSFAMLMFHAPSTDLDCELDVALAKLSIDQGVYAQTSGLLARAKGFTQALLQDWEGKPDRYLTAEQVVGLGLGQLFCGRTVDMPASGSVA